MQALVLNNGLTYRRDLVMPRAGDREALIRLRLAGICATDLELCAGYAGFSGVIGHEFVGMVEAVNDERDRHWLGHRVVGSINIGCNCCPACLGEGPEHCPRRRVLGIRGHDGVFADYFTLPVCNLFAVPDAIADEAAVFTEPLAAATRVLTQLAATPHRTVALLGPGRLGMLIAKVLASADYDVTVLGRSEASLALPTQWGLKTGLVQDIQDNQFSCVVDASGQASGFSQALRILQPRGALILKSTFAGNAAVDFSKVVVAELNIIGSRCGPFPEALSFLSRRNVPVANLIDGRYSLADGLAAIAHAARPGVRKILLQP